MFQAALVPTYAFCRAFPILSDFKALEDEGHDIGLRQFNSNLPKELEALAVQCEKPLAKWKAKARTNNAGTFQPVRVMETFLDAVREQQEALTDCVNNAVDSVHAITEGLSTNLQGPAKVSDVDTSAESVSLIATRMQITIGELTSLDMDIRIACTKRANLLRRELQSIEQVYGPGCLPVEELRTRNLPRNDYPSVSHLSFFAGPQQGFRDGALRQALFDRPQCIIELSDKPNDKSYLVADSGNHSIRWIRWERDPAMMDKFHFNTRTLVGLHGTLQHSPQMRLIDPACVVIGPSKQIFVADPG